MLEAAPRRPVCLQLSSWAGGVPGQVGGNSGLLGTRWASNIGEVAGDPQETGFSKTAAKQTKEEGIQTTLIDTPLQLRPPVNISLRA